MGYIIWLMIGILVAAFTGAGPNRRADRPHTNSSMLAGAFGGLLGGILGDGIPNVMAGQVTLPSIAAAVIGAFIFCWAVRNRASDVEP